LLGGFIGNHFVLDGNENLLQGGLRVPVLEQLELSRFKDTIVLVNAGDVDLRVELEFGGNHRVVSTAFNRHEVNIIVENGVGRANNGTVPFSERLIISLVQTVAHGLVSKLSVLSAF